MAKKFFLVLLCLTVSLLPLIAFTGCGAVTEVPETKIFDEIGMSETLAEFLDACPDRTSQTRTAAPDGEDGEKKAADWLQTRLSGFMPEGSVKRQSFDQTTTYGDAFSSQNIIASVRGGVGSSRPRIVIGTHYDNRYSTVAVSGNSRYVYFNGTNAEGAMDNATGVATLVKLAEYLSAEEVSSQMSVDVDFVFYGMGEIDYAGSGRYITELTANGRQSLLLAINIDRLGGDRIMTYFDEAPTAHGEFILNVAEEAGFGGYVAEPAANQADYASRMLDDLPYTPPYLVSDAGWYYGNFGICAMTSAADSGFFIGDRETSGSENISGTSADTLDGLKRVNGDYAKQMAVAAEMIALSVTKDGFADALNASKAAGRGYAWATFPLVGYITVAVLALGALVPIVIIVRKYERKYSEMPDPKKNVKVAVFGMDYEQPKDDDVFLDIKSVDPFEDFDGDDDADDGQEDK